MELRERVVTADAIAIGAGHTSMDARDALVELGWSVVEAEQALASVDPELPPEERVRLALRQAA
jgi:Holliday junction resolvasome RuvABC DNA-binding subunit